MKNVKAIVVKYNKNEQKSAEFGGFLLSKKLISPQHNV